VTIRPWEPKWRNVRRVSAQGGQGESWIVEAGSGEMLGFAKALRRQQSEPARKRFRRETAAYETLELQGVPRLHDHNTDCWKDQRVPLYLVMEFVDGQSLSDVVRSGGPMNLAAAIAVAVPLADVLQVVHDANIVHRDVKPGNVMIEKATLAPVLVDFGLAYAEPDVGATRVGEEVGNRFLRLPEHATGGRDPRSDITQLAGVFLYCLTGIEPRVLVDEDGRLPHQRAQIREKLDAAGAIKDLGLLRVFDRAFQTEIDRRWQTASELRGALAALASDQSQDPESLEALEARVLEISTRPSTEQLRASKARVGKALAVIHTAANTLVARLHLEMTQSGYGVDEDASGTMSGRTSISLNVPGTSVSYVGFWVKDLGGGEVEVGVSTSVEGIWRGLNLDERELEARISSSLLTNIANAAASEK
jgi:eukaryotic-like serine/threonine-protein kinase